jgi:glycosyltransferase involved in cell wall biosynthesis
MTRSVGELRVLHVSQPVDWGVARCVANLAGEQAGWGWQVAVACPPHGYLSGQVKAIGARHLPWRARRSPGPRLASEVADIAQIVRAVRPDVVHLHSSKAGLAGRLALRESYPTVFQPNCWSFQAAEGWFRHAAIAWERLAARWSTVTVCVSEAERAIAEKVGVRSRCSVVPNGIDISAFPEPSPEHRASARQRLNLADAPLVVCVGRLWRQKGQDVLLDAWPRVQAKVPAAQLILVGDGPERQALESKGLGAVIFVGERFDVRDWLTAADVVALPSRWEGMSFVLLEAMACERSLVATDVGGAREALGDDAGAIVPPENPARLADALAERLLDAAKVETEGRAGRQRVEGAYDLRHTADTIAEIYRGLV